MNQASIYHGGGFGGGGGFSAVPVSTPNPNTIRIVLEEKSWHQANSSPALSALHATALDPLYGYKTYDFNKGLGAFATFHLPHKDWIRVLTGTTKIKFFLNFYHELAVGAPNNIGYFNTNMYIFRNGETVDFAKSGGQFASIDCSGTAYRLIQYTFNNYQVADPAGSGAAGECMFFIKLRRENTGDTYANVIRFLGAAVEFPLS